MPDAWVCFAMGRAPMTPEPLAGGVIAAPILVLGRDCQLLDGSCLRVERMPNAPFVDSIMM
jgi:hypothetical protein